MANSERPQSLRRFFNRAPKSKKPQSSTVIVARAVLLSESEEVSSSKANVVRNEGVHDICLISDSPHYVVRVKETCLHILCGFTFERRWRAPGM